jgi:glycosyltransferase involved in cell wall biosynthesis
VNSLVSVIIPCYNNEKWIAEAIDSALSQTYTSIEVIVIDDGSTDKSLEIIKSYGDRIKWETGVNKGQSAARNRGFNLSSGKYIQWLDADDYLLPDKLENQVYFLEKSDSDIVYGDWKYQHHLKNGGIKFSKVITPGERQNILDALLGGFPLTIMNCLTKRELVVRLDGYDENFRAVEDIELWIRAAILGAKFRYEPGCYSVYRVHDINSNSRSDPLFLTNCYSVAFDKALKSLKSINKLDKINSTSLAKGYFLLARYYLDYDYNIALRHWDKVTEIAPEFKPGNISFFAIIVNLLGFKYASLIWHFKNKTYRYFRKSVIE